MMQRLRLGDLGNARSGSIDGTPLLAVVGLATALIGCGDMNGQPTTPTRAPLATSPEIDALVRRANAINATPTGANTISCGPASGSPHCQALIAHTLSERALLQLQDGPPSDVDGRVKGATETLHQAERALVLARPPSGADCQGRTGPDRQLVYQDSCAAVDRVRAVVRAADDAVRLDGTPEAVATRRQGDACSEDKLSCFAKAKGLEGQSRVGALAAEADGLVRATVLQIAGWSYGVSPYNALVLPSDEDLAQAEDLAKQAKDAAKQAVDARAAAAAAEQANAQKEKDAVDAARSACGLNPSLCKTRCDSGDAAACEYWGSFNLKAGGNATLGRAALAKACDTGSMPNACDQVRGLDAMLQQQAAQIDALWSEVVEPGDDLVQKTFVAEKLSRIANSPHLQRDLQKVRVFNQATVTERYCPAKKAFLAGASLAEFQKRATAHCRDEAPTAQGLSGADVTLTSQCQQVYATPCR